MLLDLVGLIGAYAAGTSRGVMKGKNAWVLILIFVYMVLQIVLTSLPEKPKRGAGDGNKTEERERQSQQGGDKEESKKRRRKLLLLLATFVMSITYVAGLSAPGGYWDSSQEGHSAGDPVLREHHSTRLKAFFGLNAIAFVMSLLIIMMLLDKQQPLDNYQRTAVPVRIRVLKAYIIVALAGLVGAYATGSSRQSDTTIWVGSLVCAVLVCIIVLRIVIPHLPIGSSSDSNARSGEDNQGSLVNKSPEKTNGGQQGNGSKMDIVEKAQSLVVLLSSLVATVAYQAGLAPPGGVWQENRNGHEAGDPILLSMQPKRYKVFFYCNSIAFAASLVIIILVRYKPVLKRRILEVAMILDLFGLIGAYSAGSCRDVTTSIYTIALAGAVLVYVVIHVTFFTLEDVDMAKKDHDNSCHDKRRKRLLLFAVLCATLTYQAGLTPPGGFRLQDDGFGHHAGDPVLFYNYPRRYNAFFYCNSVSFMLSIALIILLVNPNLYGPAIRSYALTVCIGVGFCSLVCAYAAGSTQHLKTSLYIFGLVVFVFSIMISVLTCLYWSDVKAKIMRPNSTEDEETGVKATKSPETQDEGEAKQDAKTSRSHETASQAEMEEDGMTGKSTKTKDEGEGKQKASNKSPRKDKDDESKKHANANT
ncbi:hypothetical protein GUJ93_ZPchr0006g44113 [Zizania palustris]|uniref:PGG domain-containing protein n=1 Tax=Zizania palustris TaxID=103762 RepID=A0A8J5SKA1_ZIZPA|nr:hypothetical protein GUJ93_ZPchr0006g44113 [Zizania palustris]